MQAKKSLGQNFLQDEVILNQILAAGHVTSNDTVIEIGPGTGALTEKLSASAKQVIAIEVDTDLIPFLLKKFPISSNVSILEGNILKTDISKLLSAKTTTNYKVIANIPYYITAPIIRTLLNLTPKPSEIILMVQKEVAERITAQPGDMSILALAVQRYATPQYLFSVPKTAFSPIPKVDSAIVRILPKFSSPTDDTAFFRIVKIGFSSRRKTLANNLANGLRLPKNTISDQLIALNLSPTVRAQELSLDDWEKLVQIF